MKRAKQKIAFRVDASTQIGTGHFMRCLTLADSLRARGVHTRFVSRHLPEHLCSKLTEKGHELALLNITQNNGALEGLAHASWLGVSQKQDAVDSVVALSDEKWDWLIVDHYALDSHWESVLRQVANRIMVIDDLADRQHDCDVLLDQNFYADMETRYVGKVSVNCNLLLGPSYALLRDEFRKLREAVKPRSGAVKRVLVFFGGVDVDNYTGHAIEALSQINMPGLHVDVVIGTQHPCLGKITASCAQQGFHCYVQSEKMAELMAAADLSIGAGGTASWERCCLGLPTLAFCTADNQRKLLEDAAGKGLLYSPEIKGDLVQLIGRHMLALIENSYLRQMISRNGMHAVNARGVLWVLSSLGCSDIEIEVATLDDSKKLFHWRNHPNIRAVSRNTNVIAWENHQKWFRSTLADVKKIILIGSIAGMPIGVVRFDVQDSDAEVSIYLVPEKISIGLGSELLRSAECWFAEKYPDVRQIRAHVLGGNERSQRLFSSVEYQVESTAYSKKLH